MQLRCKTLFVWDTKQSVQSTNTASTSSTAYAVPLPLIGEGKGRQKAASPTECFGCTNENTNFVHMQLTRESAERREQAPALRRCSIKERRGGVSPPETAGRVTLPLQSPSVSHTFDSSPCSGASGGQIVEYAPGKRGFRALCKQYERRQYRSRHSRPSGSEAR